MPHSVLLLFQIRPLWPVFMILIYTVDKHILNLAQTTTQIFMKFGSYTHLSKVTQVGSNQVCMIHFHRIMLN